MYMRKMIVECAILLFGTLQLLEWRNGMFGESICRVHPCKLPKAQKALRICGYLGLLEDGCIMHTSSRTNYIIDDTILWCVHNLDN